MFSVNWQVLNSPDGNGIGEHGYLRSFENRDDADAYAWDYARSVADEGGLTHIVSAEGLTLFASQSESPLPTKAVYCERITVRETSAVR